MGERVDVEALALPLQNEGRAWVAESIRALGRERDAAEAELAEWRDPDSPRRHALLEEIVLAVGDGKRSEVELREGQLAMAEAALASERAARERAERERDEAWKIAERCRRDRADALNVKTKDGLTSSEWIARTGAAERERDEARREAEKLRAELMHEQLRTFREGGEAERLRGLLRDWFSECPICGWSEGEDESECDNCAELRAALTRPAPDQRSERQRCGAVLERPCEPSDWRCVLTKGHDGQHQDGIVRWGAFAQLQDDPEPRGCPTPGACSAVERIAELEREKKGLHGELSEALSNAADYKRWLTTDNDMLQARDKRIASLEAQLAASRAENLEQARLLGMGSLEANEAERDELRKTAAHCEILSNRIAALEAALARMDEAVLEVLVMPTPGGHMVNPTCGPWATALAAAQREARERKEKP